MTTDNEKTTAAPAQPEQQPQEAMTDAEEIAQLTRDQWKNWLGSTAVVVVVLLGLMLYRSHKAKSEATANRMLGEARNPQALMAIRTQYPGTAAATLALLEVAKTQYDAGDYVMASSSYSDFLSQYPKHPMAPMAEMGKIHCTEAMGQTAEALAAYKAFAAAQADNFLAPLATFGQARCLQQLRRYDEARALYENFLTANPKTPWKGDIEDALKQIERDARKPSVML